MDLEIEMVNIRSKGPRIVEKTISFDELVELLTALKQNTPAKFNKAPAELHDCCNCEGCICEDWCEELEEKYFGEDKPKKGSDV